MSLMREYDDISGVLKISDEDYPHREPVFINYTAENRDNLTSAAITEYFSNPAYPRKEAPAAQGENMASLQDELAALAAKIAALTTNPS